MEYHDLRHRWNLVNILWQLPGNLRNAHGNPSRILEEILARIVTAGSLVPACNTKQAFSATSLHSLMDPKLRKSDNRRSRLDSPKTPSDLRRPPASREVGSRFDPQVWLFPVVVSLIVLVLGVFLRSGNYGFLQYDDNQYIQEIPAVIKGLTKEGIIWAWTNSHVGQWHPLTTMSFMLDSSLGAMKDGHGFHLTNVILHAIASVLLLLALRSLTGSFWRSAIATALFAIHPLRAESVAWITERKDVLSGCFLMANLWAYSFYARNDKSWSRYGLVCVLFILGLLSKPMLVTLPFVFLLLDFWPLKRIEWDQGPCNLLEARGFLVKGWSLLREKLPFMALAMASAVGAICAQGGAFRPIPELPWLERWSYIPSSYLTYLWQFFCPINLSPHYPYSSKGAPIGTILFCSFVLLTLTWAAWRLRKEHPYTLMGWLWFLGTMLPVIGVVSPGIQIIADRYTYLTQIGIAVAVVWAISKWLQEGVLRLSKPIIAALTGAVLLGLATIAARQTTQWKSDSILWEHALAVTKNNDYASQKMAELLQVQNNPQRAEQLYREALRLNPRLVGALNNLSLLVRAKGSFDEAVELQKRAVNEHPKWGLMHRNMASALLQQQKLSEAKQEYLEAIRLDPNDSEAEFNYALLLSHYEVTSEKLEEAASRFRNCITRQPNFVEAHFCYGNCMYGLNRMEEAATAYQRALQLNPNHARAANNLASIFSNQGKHVEAVALYQRAIKADSNYLEAAQNLAEALIRTGNYADSIQVWRAIVTAAPSQLQATFRLSWILATAPDASVRRPFEARDIALKAIETTGGKHAVFYDSLAAAYSHLDNFEDAKEAIRKAAELQKDDPASLTVIRQRLALYENRQPFIDDRSVQSPAGGTKEPTTE